jgi:O-acetyl-ADP-ribose deacetylase (regulator of RNase III)
MIIQLVDKKPEMCKFWRMYFRGIDNVIVSEGDFFALSTDCVCSPANSFGFMDGGLDLLISLKIGWQVQEKLQKQIRENYHGELLVGQAELVETDFPEIPYVISAPTMRVPLILENTPNVYLSAKAIFLLLKKHEDKIKTVTISGLGTGVGRVPFELCAKQMRLAYNDVNNMNFPDTWKIAQERHYYLCDSNLF